MSLVANFWKAAARGLDVVRYSGTGGQGYSNWGSTGRLLPSSEFDYQKEAGILWLSGIVSPILNFATEGFREAPLVVRDESDRLNPKSVEGHYLLDLFQSPHPDISPELLWDAVVTNRVCGGNGYMRLVPSKGFAINPRTQITSRIAQVVPVNYWQMHPQWPADGSQFISHYMYRVDGYEEALDKRIVLQFRDRYDPLNPRVGLSRLVSVLREICGDNEAATATAAIMRNRGMGNLIISPSPSKDGLDIAMTAEQRTALKEIAAEKMTGDRRGSPLVPSMPVDVKEIGFEPDKMAFDRIRNLSADRVCAAYNIDPMAVGLPSQSKTYSNFREAERAAYRKVLHPMWTQVESVLNQQLLKVFYPDDFARGYRLRFDTSDVAALQDDVTDVIKRVTMASGGPVMTPNEGRAEIGLNPIEGGDELRKPMAGKPSALVLGDERGSE